MRFLSTIIVIEKLKVVVATVCIHNVKFLVVK
nr:MAG TPA: hypothetical protein [Caudoviricetes sp.]